MSEYSEHDKQKAVLDDARVIGEFLDWASSQGYQLCRFSDRYDEFNPVGSFLDVLAEYFEIDLDKIEAEKRQMLESIRAANGG